MRVRARITHAFLRSLLGSVALLLAGSSCFFASESGFGSSDGSLKNEVYATVLDYTDGLPVYSTFEPITPNQAVVNGKVDYFQLTLGVLPSGLELDPDTGLLSGTPTVVWNEPIKIGISAFAGGQVLTRLLDIRVLNAIRVDSSAEGNDPAPGDGVCGTGPGTCTLRAAVEEANATFGMDMIRIPNGNFLLGLGQINHGIAISRSLVIRGDSTSGVQISMHGSIGTPNHQAFRVTAGADVRFETMTIHGINVAVSSLNGAAIRFEPLDNPVQGIYAVKGVEFRNNTARNGGAISIGITAAQRQWLTRIENCYFEGNSTLTGSGTSLGGAIQIYNEVGNINDIRFTQIRNSGFYDNSSAGSGAAISLDGGIGSFPLAHSTFVEKNIFLSHQVLGVSGVKGSVVSVNGRGAYYLNHNWWGHNHSEAGDTKAGLIFTDAVDGVQVHGNLFDQNIAANSLIQNSYSIAFNLSSNLFYKNIIGSLAGRAALMVHKKTANPSQASITLILNNTFFEDAISSPIGERSIVYTENVIAGVGLASTYFANNLYAESPPTSPTIFCTSLASPGVSALSIGHNTLENRGDCASAIGDIEAAPRFVNVAPIDKGGIAVGGALLGTYSLHVLMPEGPELDSGHPDYCGISSNPKDQIGQNRIMGSSCDRGAYEVDPEAS